MHQIDPTLSPGAVRDIAELGLGADRVEVALNALRESDLSPENIAGLKRLLDTVERHRGAPYIVSEKLEFKDKRPGFKPHRAVKFTVNLNRERKLNDLLEGLLGESAALLMADFGGKIDFTRDAPTASEVVLFLDSNNKARDRGYVQSNARTTQEDDFKVCGLEMADDLKALIVCASLVKKARILGLKLAKEVSSWKDSQTDALRKFDGTEIDLLSKLRDGKVRSQNGNLFIMSNGTLRAHNIDDFTAFENHWALGSAPQVANPARQFWFGTMTGVTVSDR